MPTRRPVRTIIESEDGIHVVFDDNGEHIIMTGLETKRVPELGNPNDFAITGALKITEHTIDQGAILKLPEHRAFLNSNHNMVDVDADGVQFAFGGSRHPNEILFYSDTGDAEHLLAKIHQFAMAYNARNIYWRVRPFNPRENRNFVGSIAHASEAICALVL